MPRLVQLQENYPKQLKVYSLNVDFDSDDGEPPAMLKEQIAMVLAELGGACEHLVSTERTNNMLDGLEIYSLPAALVYDAEQNIVKRFDGGIDYDAELIPLVASLVEKAK